MSPEHRAILERMRSSAGVVRRVVEDAPPDRFGRAPVFGDFDEEGYRRASLARGEAVTDLLDTIVAEHEQLARLLQTLPDADWSRQGRHPSIGVMSIEFLARRVGEHAEEHAAQIAAAMQADPAEGNRSR